MKFLCNLGAPPYEIRLRMGRHIMNPVWAWIALAAAVLPVAAAESPVRPDRKTVFVLGDSLAAGYGLDPSEAFPALLQKKVDAAGLPFEIVNAGVSGDTTAGGLRRLDWLLRRRIDVLVLELGGNDGLRGLTPSATQSNLQAIIERTRAKYPAAEIVVAGMQMPPNLGTEYREAFQKVFPEVARRHHAALIPFLLEGVGGKPDLNLPDGIHPTAEGHRIVAETVWSVLQPVLGRLARDGKPASSAP
jgi:acyl-CoA thioesterase-1